MVRNMRCSKRNSSRSPYVALVAPIALAAALFLATGVPAIAATIPHGTLELLAENQSLAAGGTVELALHFQLEPGWHIYWINPGDSGEPPRVTWQLPSGLTAGELLWPAPQRLGTASIVDFGYRDEVALLVPLHAEASLPADRPAQLAAEVKVLVCREVCIPGKAELSLTLPVALQAPAKIGSVAALFTAARKSLPRAFPRNWTLQATENHLAFELTARLDRQVTQAMFFPLLESQIDNAAPQEFAPAPNGFRLTLRKSDQLLKPPARLQGLLVVSGQAYAIDVPLLKSAAAGGAGNEFHPRHS